jgi:hypothetical protein
MYSPITVKPYAKQALLQWSGFNPSLGHVGFVVDKVALGLVFSRCFSFPSLHDPYSPVIWVCYNRSSNGWQVNLTASSYIHKSQKNK